MHFLPRSYYAAELIGDTMPAFDELPTEILAQIVSSCNSSKDLAATALACHRLRRIAGPLLYKRQILLNDYHVAFWAARKNRVATLQQLARVSKPGDALFDVFRIRTVCSD